MRERYQWDEQALALLPCHHVTRLCDSRYEEECYGCWHRPAVAAALREQAEKYRSLGVHLSHCNQGEYLAGCKYGDVDDCPALTDSWSWFGKRVTELENGNTDLTDQLRQAQVGAYAGGCRYDIK